MLPLHIAVGIPNVPYAILQAIAEGFPPAVTEVLDFGFPAEFKRKLPLTFAFSEKVCWRWALCCDGITGAPLDEACVKYEHYSSSPWIGDTERTHGAATHYDGRSESLAPSGLVMSGPSSSGWAVAGNTSGANLTFPTFYLLTLACSRDSFRARLRR